MTMYKLPNFSRFGATVVLVASAMCADAQSPPSTGADAGWAAMTKCAAMADEKARHRCSDDVLRNAGLVPAAGAGGKEAPAPVAPATVAPAAASRAAAATVPADQSSRPADFGLPAKPAALPSPSRSPKRVDVVLASVAKGEHGALVFTTSDGATWWQVNADGNRVMPEAGQTMTIEKAPLGGYLCKPEKQIFFRCSRTQ
jgi:hypothetical protein